MTALKKYERLECIGLWRDGPADQRREVVVRFGAATLMLTDPNSEVALSHWSLPAVARVNPGQMPAVFSPGADSVETLELEDSDMIAALQTVQTAIKSATPHPWRLRGALFGGAMLLILGVAVLWLPGALVAHTASVVPAAKRAEIGQMALDDIVRLTGAPCTGDVGLPALAKLSERVFGPADTPILYVLREGLKQPSHLPGDVILLPRALVETGESPEALAGAALAEGVAADLRDPMIPVLDHVGLVATFRLLTSGDLPDGALSGFGEAFLSKSTAPAPDAALLAAFSDAQIPVTPYALARDPSGEGTKALIEADPYKVPIAVPLMPDGDWIALQSVCAG